MVMGRVKGLVGDGWCTLYVVIGVKREGALSVWSRLSLDVELPTCNPLVVDELKYSTYRTSHGRKFMHTK